MSDRLTPRERAVEQLWRALSAPGEAEADLRPFSAFFGTWDVDIRDSRPGRPERMHGTWTFGPALEGRAVIDVWSVPDYECGMSVRFYDPAIDAWRSTWHGPAHGMVATFIVREDDDRIILDATTPSMLGTSWIFSDIAADSFHWCFSERGTVVQTMVATRRS